MSVLSVSSHLQSQAHARRAISIPPHVLGGGLYQPRTLLDDVDRVEPIEQQVLGHATDPGTAIWIHVHRRDDDIDTSMSKKRHHVNPFADYLWTPRTRYYRVAHVRMLLGLSPLLREGDDEKFVGRVTVVPGT